MGKIKNIIFDLGGVILGIDYQKTITEFEMLGIENFEEIYTQMKQDDLFDKLETGQINEKEFISSLKAKTGLKVENQLIIDAWNAMLLKIPKANIEYINEKSKYYRCFLLSNTNEIHYRKFWAQVSEEHGLKDFSDFMKAEYYSHLLKRRKPDVEAFQIILDENNLKPEETLFIDDSPQHLEGAKKLGIKTHHHTEFGNWEKVEAKLKLP